MELAVNETFKNLVPKMTREEYNQLEQNILEDGYVREPIVYWNGYIIDGHHRYQIAKEHPEIKYETVEKHFDSEDDAIIWICKNQLGRRNIQDRDRKYLIGKEQEARKHLMGASAGNKNAVGADHHKGADDSMANDEDKKTDQQKWTRTAEQVGEKYGVSPRTVHNAEQFAKGADIAEQNAPGAMEKIRSGESRVSQKIIEEIPKAAPDVQAEASKAIVNNDVDKAKELLIPPKESTEDEGSATSEEEPVIEEDIIVDEAFSDEPDENDEFDLTTQDGVLGKLDAMGDEWAKQAADLFDEHGDVFDSLASIKAAATKFKDQIDKLQDIRTSRVKKHWDEMVAKKTS